MLEQHSNTRIRQPSVFQTIWAPNECWGQEDVFLSGRNTSILDFVFPLIGIRKNKQLLFVFLKIFALRISADSFWNWCHIFFQMRTSCLLCLFIAGHVSGIFFVVCLLRCRTRFWQGGCSLGWGVNPSRQNVHECHHCPTFCWDLWRGWQQMQQIQGHSTNPRVTLPQAFPKPAGVDHPPTGKTLQRVCGRRYPSLKRGSINKGSKQWCQLTS